MYQKIQKIAIHMIMYVESIAEISPLLTYT
jgi:hypothetical protein